MASGRIGGSKLRKEFVFGLNQSGKRHRRVLKDVLNKYRKLLRCGTLYVYKDRGLVLMSTVLLVLE